MKKTALLLLGTGIFLISCNSGNQKPGEAKNMDVIKMNLRAANAIDSALETGDVSHLGDYIQTDAVDHSDMNGDVKGLDKIKKGLAGVHTLAKNDIKFKVIKEVADNDYVFQWLVVSGTAATGDMGVPPDHRFEINEIGVSKYKNGKATDYWEYMRASELIKMLNPPKAEVAK
jgi:hypothetical protein